MLRSRKSRIRTGTQRACCLLLIAITQLLAYADEGAKTRQARVKDIASVAGVRDNQLVGYGICRCWSRLFSGWE
jgi:flagellar P-ring protein precursor FlgI